MKKLGLKSRFCAIAIAALVASCFAVPSAFAQVYYDGLTEGDVSALPGSALDVSTDARPTAAATRAAMPAPDILGLVGVEESGQFVEFQTVEVIDEVTEEVIGSWIQPVFTWDAPKYMIFATSYNCNPNPYLVNFAVHDGTMVAYNPSRGGSGNGPNQVLAASGDPTDEAVWSLGPDIIIGDGDKTAAELDSYRTGYDHYDYIKYNVSHFSDIVTTVAAIRDAVNNSAVTTIANEYIAYIQGAYNTVPLAGKTVALVTNYDSTNGYTIGASTATDGTATLNRYLETALYAGATNLNTNTTADPMYVNSTTLATADLILVGGQQGSANYTAIMNALFNDQLLNKTYFVKDNAMGTGSTYGVCMNSIENAQNIGRILQPITGLSQRDSLAYYYEHFYHIRSANLAHVMDMALDGVRNWNRSIDWTTFDGDVYDAIDYLTTWDIAECGYTPAAP